MSRIFFLVMALTLFWMAASASGQIPQGENLAEISGVVSVDGVHPGSRFEAAVVVQLAGDWHVNAHQPTLDYLIPTELALEPAEGLHYGEVVYPEAENLSFAFADEKLAVYQGRFPLRVSVQAKEGIAPGKHTVRGRLTYQACNDTQCLAPVTMDVEVPVRVVDAGTPINRINTDIFSDVGLVDAPGGASGNSENRIAGLVEEGGMAYAFLLIFLGGLALNLTPCVYPIIPVTVSYFGGQSEGRTGRLFLLSSAYVGGIAVAYSALGVAAALSGEILGASLQNPWVLSGIAGLLILLALSTFGVYELRPPAFLMRRGGSQSGVSGAALMGLTMGVVAAPCIGPFVLGLLTYVGAAGDPALGFWMFFVLALGLGLPYLFLGTFSGMLKQLPGSGVWMVWVKHLFGVVLVGMALYFVNPLIPEAVFPWILALFLAGSGLYLGWLDRSAAGLRWARGALGAACIAASVWAVLPSGPEAEEAFWIPYREVDLETARDIERPVLIDFYADWCLPCKELDALTFSDPAVREAAGDFLMVKADVTRYGSPEVEQLKEHYDIRGVPTVVFLGADGRERWNLRVVGFVGAEEMLRRMRQTVSGNGQQAAR